MPAKNESGFVIAVVIIFLGVTGVSGVTMLILLGLARNTFYFHRCYGCYKDSLLVPAVTLVTPRGFIGVTEISLLFCYR